MRKAILMLSPEILAGTRVTLGRGSWLLQLPLLVHVAAGITGLLTGFLALSLVKGSEGHRRIGRVFVTAMIVMGAVGAAIAAYEHKLGSVAGGFLSAYFVVTAMLTVRPWTAPRWLQYQRRGCQQPGRSSTGYGLDGAGLSLVLFVFPLSFDPRDGLPGAGRQRRLHPDGDVVVAAAHPGARQRDRPGA